MKRKKTSDFIKNVYQFYKIIHLESNGEMYPFLCHISFVVAQLLIRISYMIDLFFGNYHDGIIHYHIFLQLGNFSGEIMVLITELRDFCDKVIFLVFVY